MPRLARSVGAQVERYVLLGRDQFLVGRGAHANIVLEHASMHLGQMQVTRDLLSRG